MEMIGFELKHDVRSNNFRISPIKLGLVNEGNTFYCLEDN